MGKIDFHAHYLSPEYVNYLDHYFNGYGDGVATPKWNVEDHLQLMKDFDIDYSVLSISSPHLSAGSKETTVQLAQDVNGFAADVADAHPTKFGFFASLPLPYVDESIKSIDEAVSLHAQGFTLPTNVQGTYIGDDSFDAVMAKLNDVNALVTLHPNAPQPMTSAATDVKVPLMEFFFDTTRTVVNMAQHNIFSKYTNITWLIPHAGALLPIIAQRISVGGKFLNDGDQEPDDMLEVMGHLYFDTAGMVLPYQLPTLLKMTTADKLVYGSDFPYTPNKVVGGLADQLEQTDQLTDQQKQQIFSDTARKLIKLPN
ncbi:amidohydrolase family protein [Paucilactobacillus suebicus]|uniref:6-methylsalicylate decarboxylase n=1 Tax=Paucilactobacillus suebicus DSM 5007 = KCTC 3549 TaxID=1423807 RepID=A0A0R1W7F7_9LACO|nr:amidohydrolase family protein [Paucilactobacillus suebicus]KRM11844.1 hypothetical protein FD16_GL000516 [Paucilactobacillus suebicus DSM 5007 = KCTC 3549]